MPELRERADVEIPIASDEKAQKARKLVVGIVLVFLIAISQVAASQFAKFTYQPGFSAPFFITWFDAIGLVICYPVYFLCAVLKCGRKQSLKGIWRQSSAVFGSDGLTLRRWIVYGGIFSFLAVGTNYSYVRALGVSKPSDVTALFASNSAFVFLLSCAVLGAQILSLKVLSVGLAMAGIVLIAYSDGFLGPGFMGVLLATTAAFGAALYTVLFKKVVGNAKSDQVSLFLSVVASFTAVMFWPMILILHYSEYEVVTQNVPWKFLAGSCSSSIVFNFLINYGTAYTYPLFIAFGGIVGIPLNHVADWVFRHNQFDAMKIGGTVLIIAAFVLIVALPAHVDKEFHLWITSCGKRRDAKPTEEEKARLDRTGEELIPQDQVGLSETT